MNQSSLALMDSSLDGCWSTFDTATRTGTLFESAAIVRSLQTSCGAALFVSAAEAHIAANGWPLSAHAF
jgi:hypothetical protein